jgi:hypothetical protein
MEHGAWRNSIINYFEREEEGLAGRELEKSLFPDQGPGVAKTCSLTGVPD